MSERGFLSIGEVLSLLRDEFPDITISKIRFLESQGLLDPERTPSGYRKFYDADVDRLRWILRQQRENFLPLKVIKGRLTGDGGDTAGGADDGGDEAGGDADAGGDEQPAAEAGPSEAGPSEADATPAPVASPRPQPGATPPYKQEQSLLSAGPTGVNVTFDELSTASGLAPDKLDELERFGFFAGRPVAGVVYYDEEAMVIASLAGRFLRYGIEARHLRTYKNAAEREAGLFEQIVTPLLKQRNPQARGQAVKALEDLSGMGQSLRAALLRQALKGITGG